MPTTEKLDSLATSFDRVLNVEGKSPRTRILYAQSITYLSDWLTAEGLAADLSSLPTAICWAGWSRYGSAG